MTERKRMARYTLETTDTPAQIQAKAQGANHFTVVDVKDFGTYRLALLESGSDQRNLAYHLGKQNLFGSIKSGEGLNDLEQVGRNDHDGSDGENFDGVVGALKWIGNSWGLYKFKGGK